MRQLKLSEKNHINCMTFANDTRQEVIRALQQNKRINVRLKHESLDNAGALGKSAFNEKHQAVAEALLVAKKKGISSLLGVEQGVGKNRANACVCFKQNMTAEAKNGIRQNHRTKFSIPRKTACVSSLPKLTADEESNTNELNDCIVNRLKVIATNENNQPEQKTFLETVT